MFVINYRSFFITLSSLLVVVSIAAVVIFGLPLGIDFKGGSALELQYSGTRPEITVLKAQAKEAGFTDISVQPFGDTGVLVKSHTLSEDERSALVASLTGNGSIAATQNSFTTIGPSVGTELARKALVSVVLVLLAIVLFVAYAFRGVSTPVSSWKYGIATILALMHDIAIPLGAFAILAHNTGAELDTLFIVAILTTLALSVSDTIVVFDRIRENLKTGSHNKKSFEHTVGESLSQTFVRSINTSLVVLIVVIALAVVGPASTRLFAIVLAIGMFFGTYSSIFLASPLLVLMEKLQHKKR